MSGSPQHYSCLAITVCLLALVSCSSAATQSVSGCFTVNATAITQWSEPDLDYITTYLYHLGFGSGIPRSVTTSLTCENDHHIQLEQQYMYFLPRRWDDYCLGKTNVCDKCPCCTQPQDMCESSADVRTSDLEKCNGQRQCSITTSPKDFSTVTLCRPSGYPCFYENLNWCYSRWVEYSYTCVADVIEPVTTESTSTSSTMRVTTTSSTSSSAASSTAATTTTSADGAAEQNTQSNTGVVVGVIFAVLIILSIAAVVFTIIFLRRRRIKAANDVKEEVDYMNATVDLPGQKANLANPMYVDGGVIKRNLADHEERPKDDANWSYKYESAAWDDTESVKSSSENNQTPARDQEQEHPPAPVASNAEEIVALVKQLNEEEDSAAVLSNDKAELYENIEPVTNSEA